MGRVSKDKRDIYYRKAKEDGYESNCSLFNLVLGIGLDQLTSFFS